MLIQMVQQGRVPHALLLSSHAGSVALRLAHSFITYLHCLHKTSSDACGKCFACRKAHKLIHPDIHYLFPWHGHLSQGKKEAKIAAYFAQWRSFFQQLPYGDLEDWQRHVGEETRQSTITKAQIHYLHGALSKKSLESSCKTILVWLPERLHPAAANAMLKMIEEPAPHTYFLFVSSDLHHIIPTLQSRLWPFHIPPCEDTVLTQLLEQHHPDASADQVIEVVQIAAGNINLALKTMAQPPQRYFEMFSQWMRALYAQRFDEALQAAETFHAYSHQVQRSWVHYALQMLRHVLLHPFRDQMRLHHTTKEEKVFCQKFQVAVQKEMVMFIVQQLNEMYFVLQRNANAKLAFMATSITISSRFLAQRKVEK